MGASVKSSKSMLFSYKPEEKDLFIQISLKKKLGFQKRLWATVSIRPNQLSEMFYWRMFLNDVFLYKYKVFCVLFYFLPRISWNTLRQPTDTLVLCPWPTAGFRVAAGCHQALLPSSVSGTSCSPRAVAAAALRMLSGLLWLFRCTVVFQVLSADLTFPFHVTWGHCQFPPVPQDLISMLHFCHQINAIAKHFCGNP